ncbi:hypothetical protein CICLE_v10003900mg [Citrus x clementina]|uniref:Uncharacterized protein n=1 Tax=Citrus clementina TaxID=85681 RepID=V4T6L3_CITCL|nr:hypothetical protein CICLE_v10003900mg [Citrus x clementina]
MEKKRKDLFLVVFLNGETDKAFDLNTSLIAPIIINASGPHLNEITFSVKTQFNKPTNQNNHKVSIHLHYVSKNL